MSQPLPPLTVAQPTPLAPSASGFELIGALSRRLNVPLADLYRAMEGRVMVVRIQGGAVLFRTNDVERLMGR